MLVAVTGIAGLVLVLAPASYRAEARVLIGARTFGLIGLRAQAAALDHEGKGVAVTKGQAQLVASRDLARRAIEELGIDSRPEFDSVAGGRGTASHLLVLLGLKRDPARMSRSERILQAYEDRLSVRAEPSARLITIAFESEDRDLAANVANRIADLYLEMRAETKDRTVGVPEARIVSRAVSPHHPVFPREAWAMALGLSATFATALGTIVAGQRLRTRRDPRSDEPVEQPRTLGETRMLARLDVNERPSSLPKSDEAKFRGAVVVGARAVATVARHIVSARRRGSGTNVLITSCSEAQENARFTLDLARRLGQDARAILVGLDKDQRLDVALRAPEFSADGGGHGPGAPRIAELFEGRVSFAEVIRRDPSSRLHYVAAEPDRGLDLAGSESVFEALAKTYDFVILVAPPLDRDNAAMTLAAAADLVVLAAPPQPNDLVLRKAEADLLDRGAREVQIVGLPSRLRRSVASSLGRDAA